MLVAFVERENGPERLVCEAEVIFQEGPLEGAKLVGFTIWRSVDGILSVTFPARSFGAGGERRFFDYVRAVEPGGDVVKRIKTWILDEYRQAEASR